jgi:hypothetical protein
MPPSLPEPARAVQALRLSPIPALRQLTVEETETIVTITGTVSSYYMKQLAQEAVMSTLAGRKLHNGVAVVPAPQSQVGLT